MWPTLKAELEYNTTPVAIFGLMVAAAVWGAIALEGGNVYAVITNTSVAVIFVHIFINQRRKKERFARRSAILPQSLSTASWSRFLAIGVLQAVVLTVWLVMYLAFHVPDDAGAIWKVLSSNALLMIVLVVTIAEADCVSWHEPGRMIVNLLLGTVAFAALFVSFANMGSYVFFHLDTDSQSIIAYVEFLKTPVGALLTNAALVGAVAVVHQLYTHRQSFVR
jgi:hypothetical protein